jgi:ABC-type transport system involved in multi-copper enzyme maturation permease subunit
MSALFDQSYQEWKGTLHGHAWRFFAIAWRNQASTFRRSPALIIVLGGVATLIGALSGVIGSLMLPFLEPAMKVAAAFDNSVNWALLLVLPTVGSALIANDVAHNALLMYFSKAITRFDYLAGKACAGIVFLVPVILVGPLIAVGLCVNQMDEKVVTHAWSARFALGTLAVVPFAVIPPIAIIMAFSSCTRRTFLAGTGWVVSYLILSTAAAILQGGARLKWGYLLSITGNVTRIAAAILPDPPKGYVGAKVPPGFPTNEVMQYAYSPWYSVAILAGLTVVSFAVVIWRLSQAERRS